MFYYTFSAFRTDFFAYVKKKLYLCSVLGKCCIWVCVAVCLFTGCSRRALHEAQAVVAQADSARAEGRMYGTEKADSIALAQAYHTLNNHPLSPYTLHLPLFLFHLSSFLLLRSRLFPPRNDSLSGYGVSVMGYGLWGESAFGFWLLAFGFWLLAFGFWLLAFSAQARPVTGHR